MFRETGEMSNLGTLYERYMSLVYGVCLKYLKDQDDSKDAVMEVFESLPDKLKRHEIENFQSWLYVIVKNHCLMQLRKSKRSGQVPMEEISYKLMETDSDEHHNDKELLEEELVILENGINHLPDQQKQCITLFYLEKKSYQEIADQTGYELKKVKSYIQNGKRNLRIYFDSQE